MSTPRFIKFDGVHPSRYLNLLHEEHADVIGSMSFWEYHRWIMDQKINYSDFYTHNLKEYGWETHEFLFNDPVYFEKAAGYLFGKRKNVHRLKESLKDKLRPVDFRWKRYIVKQFIRYFKPDVIFVREGNPFPSAFWSEFSGEALLVNRIAMNFPKIWNPMYFDLIFTSLEDYKKVFERNGIPSYLFFDGFDQRINEMLEGTTKSVDIAHAGGAGYHLFRQKSQLFEKVASEFDFHWYGWGQQHLPADSPLHKAWKGYLSGLEMYRLYKSSRIVLNDYGDVARGVAVNQRIFETLGVGSFLLTREAENLKSSFPADIFVTFRDDADCLDKIRYFLQHEKEREEIAARGMEYARKELNYKDLMGKLDGILREHLAKKFPARKF